jgi:hypothetical protein
MGTGSTAVGEVAVAALGVVGPACSLALGGGLAFGGSASVTATTCTLASNRNDSQSITFNGAGANKTQANGILVGAGGCTQSGSGSPCTQPGNMMYQPPTVDPYQALLTDANAIPSAVNNANCGSATSNSPFTISSSSQGTVYCVGSDLKLTNGSAPVDLNPQWATQAVTYFFWNSSITVNGGSLTCRNCTIIFTGSAANKLGSLSLTGGSTVNMTAAKTSAYADGGATPNNYNGLLFYMDNQFAEHSNACGNAQVSIQGNSTTTLNGGMYFPNASLCVTGSAFSATTNCLSLVAWSIQYTGNATENLTGCSTTGTKTALVQSVNLVQ